MNAKEKKIFSLKTKWKLFGRKWGADEEERNAAGRPLCQQCGSKQLLA